MLKEGKEEKKVNTTEEAPIGGQREVNISLSFGGVKAITDTSFNVLP